MSNRPRPSQPPERRQLTRRQLADRQREANVQRRVLIAISAAVGLALLLIVAGFVYTQLIEPSRTIKQVNDQALTRSDYENLVRDAQVQQLTQSLYLSRLIGAGGSFGQGSPRFSEQIIEANLGLTEIGTARSRAQEVDPTLVDQWVDRQLIETSAQQQFQIDPSQGEVDQLIVEQYGSLLQSADPLTTTDTVTDTAEGSPDASAAASADASAASPDASAPATATPQPTATPGPEEATTQVSQITQVLYDELENVLGTLPEEAPARQRTPHVTQEQIASVLRAQFREQLIRERVGAALVAEAPADDTSEPEQISARHILLQVPEPTETPDVSGTPGPTEDEATATAEASAEATAVPTPTLTPDELEQAFEERKQEADRIYQQLIADPDSFPDVARELSDDTSSAVQGGDVGTFNREGQTLDGNTLVPEFTDAAWALQPNEISQPVRTEFGWHIIQRLPEDPEARLERLRTTAFNQWLDQQRQAATIVPAPTPTPTIEPLPSEEAEDPPAASDGASAAPDATTTP